MIDNEIILVKHKVFVSPKAVTLNAAMIAPMTKITTEDMGC